jgi:hypothetical protein
MNEHHEMLLQQFQQLADVRNELKQAIDTTESTSQDEETSYMMKIDQWERDNIQRIQQAAAEFRTNIQHVMTASMAGVRSKLEDISTNMQQREKEGSCMEQDIAEVKNQLERLKDAIKHMNEKSLVKPSNRIDWSALISDVKENTPGQHLMDAIRASRLTYSSEGTNRSDNNPSQIGSQRLTENYSNRHAMPSFTQPELFSISTIDRSDRNPHSGSSSRNRQSNSLSRKAAAFSESRESVNDRLFSSGYDIPSEKVEESSSRLSDAALKRTPQNCKQK